jgi:hypothetical protein
MEAAKLNTEQERAKAGKKAEGSEGPSHEAPSNPILRLQRQVGNSVVSRMIAQRAVDAGNVATLQRESEGEEEEVQESRDPALQRHGDDGHDHAQLDRDHALQRFIQRESEGEEEEVQESRDASLQRSEGEEEEVQESRDPALQRESEGEEEEVQESRDASLQRSEGEEEEVQESRDPALQRESEGDEEEVQESRDAALQRSEGEEEEVQESRDASLQREPIGPEGGQASSDVSQRIASARGGGSAMDSDTKGSMESAFGTDFGDVRIHTGGESSALNKDLGAKAFTTGNDVFMRDDAYQPGTPDAQRLLGHELTHVVQQRTMPSSGPGTHVGPAGDQYEQAADAKAAEIMTMREEGHQH